MFIYAGNNYETKLYEYELNKMYNEDKTTNQIDSVSKTWIAREMTIRISIWSGTVTKED